MTYDKDARNIYVLFHEILQVCRCEKEVSERLAADSRRCRIAFVPVCRPPLPEDPAPAVEVAQLAELGVVVDATLEEASPEADVHQYVIPSLDMTGVNL